MKLRLHLITELEGYDAIDDPTELEDNDKHLGSAPKTEISNDKTLVSNPVTQRSIISVGKDLLPQTIRSLKWGWWLSIVFVGVTFLAHHFRAVYQFREAK